MRRKDRSTQASSLKVLSDTQLMERIAHGDKAAYSILLERNLSASLGFASQVLGRRIDAEDAVQEAFVKIWVKAQSFDANKARFKTWAYRILLNQCLDIKRKRRFDQHLDDFEIEDHGINPEAAAQQMSFQATIQKGLALLPERQRTAVALCYFDELSNKEAAQVMDISVKALESLLSRARAQLKKGLLPIEDAL